MSLLEALRRTLALVESSGSSPYATEGPPALAGRLRVAIAALQSGTTMDVVELRWLFAPTGALQETSLANGWGDEFLSLADVVDVFLTTGERGR